MENSSKMDSCVSVAVNGQSFENISAILKFNALAIYCVFAFKWCLYMCFMCFRELNRSLF